MNGITLMVLGLALAAEPVELPKDVEEVETREFALPIRLDPDRREKIERLRLFVSEDKGKSWKHDWDYKPTDLQASFTAPRDGLYWLTLQAVTKDGKRPP